MSSEYWPVGRYLAGYCVPYVADAGETVAGWLGAGSRCASTRPYGGGAGIVLATFCGGAGRSALYELESKRAESEQPAAATPTSARAATRGQTRGRDSTLERNMWLLTRTRKTSSLK